MTFEERYKQLNKKQKKAVDTIDGPLLVVAGPGSGKTEILSLRVGNILEQTQVLASNILCLTFTESATVNMRKRLSGLIGSEAYRVAIHTFHNFCVEIIQRYPQYFYGGAFFSPADELAQVQIMEEIFDKLSHDHPFSSYHPEQGYVYLKDVLMVISYLKKAGLDPVEFEKIIKHNQKSLEKIDEVISENLSERLNKENLGKIGQAVTALLKLAEDDKKGFVSEFFSPISVVITESLKIAVDKAIEEGKMTPLSTWKAKWLRKNDAGQSLLKDSLSLDKMLALSQIYAKYREIMYSKGYYDFDDMILDVITALKNNPALRYEIQEQYQYVLVDEFQDTNDAQMRLIRYITDAPVNEGRPNIMAVGDDDQAVYKFQGAELSNILNFKKLFKDVEIVTMTDNYRSTQDILDVASHVIKKGEERLEKLLPEIEKNLVASNPKLKSGDIVHREFPTVAHEYHFISREIKKKIEAGEKPEEIAVIARKHKQLQALVPYLQAVNVPIRYEREQNVFKEPHIAQLIVLAKFITTLADKNKDEADEYLPQILSFPFWQVSREDIWKISLGARRGDHGKTWLEVMLEYSNPKIVEIAKFLINLGVAVQSEPLEQVLDKMIGAHVQITADPEDTDGEEEDIDPKKEEGFGSPFKDFYFSKEKFEHARAEYLAFLSSLRVFVNALREYKVGEILSLKDLIEFVDLHEKNNIALNDQSPFAKLGGAVNFLTSHKAKGLEFETVFVLSCQEDIWAGRPVPSKLVLPSNLPIRPAGDTEDDQLRLFYVAITRAKRHLYLTSYLQKEGGESSDKLRFLIAEEGEEAVMKKESLRKIYFGKHDYENEVAPEAHEVLTASWLSYHTPPFVGTEEKLLKSLLEDYQMPITHLNNFLDIEKGGPQYFLEQNLLHFPQAKTVSGAYGSAIHHTLENVLLYLKKEDCLPEQKDVLEWFTVFLKKERLAKADYVYYTEKGCSDLAIFYEARKDTFKQKDLVEFNFKEQGVVVDGAHLSGKIDRIIDLGMGNCAVLDYKTGKPLMSWEENDPYKKKKSQNYQRQLLYYKLLVENSRDFSGKLKVTRGLLDFIEPKSGKTISLEKDIDSEDVERLAKLIGVVYQKIMTLDFPDVSKYSKDVEGIEQFEEDLLAGTI
jgi:DNA helicase-2/ATP-dependent DNA helicase PcrA